MLIIFKSKLNIHSQCSEMVHHNFLNIDVLKSVRVIDQLSFILNSVLIFLKSASPPSIGSRTNIIDSLWLNSSAD